MVGPARRMIISWHALGMIDVHTEGVWDVFGYVGILNGVGTSPSTFANMMGANMALR